jgi:molecular chaperone GrpE (heat shock protein)
MATGTRALTLKLLADVDNFTKNLDKADKDVATFGDKVTKFGKAAGLAFAAAGAAAVAYAGKLAIDGVKSAIADAAAQEKLALTLKNVTGATEDQIAATEDYITKTSLAFGVTDDDLRPSLERLSRATGDLSKAQKLQAVALDVSAGSGKSLEAVTNAMAKAAEGNTAALAKLGIGLSSTQLKTMSMDEITTKLADTFENQASTKADTFQGKLTRLQIAFDEGKETVGSYILTAITPMVELLVKQLIPAIQDFADNLSQNLAPIIKIFKPVLDGLRSAFNSVKDSLAENNEELQPFFNFMKIIYNFAKDYLAPIIGKTLGAAFSVLGDIIAGVIDTFATFVSTLTKIYNSVKGIIDAIKGAGSAVGNFFGASTVGSASFSNASFSTSSQSSAPALSAEIMDSDARLRAFAQGRTTSITVNGAIDPESTARQIVGLLNDSSARGTLGGSGLVFV